MSDAQPPSSAAVPAVGAAVAKRILGRDTDAYSEAQFAKPGIPRTQWNQDDQAARATGAQPTKCAAMQMTVSVTDTGLRCYRISITGWKTIVVVHQVDTDAETLLRAAVPTLDTLPTREVVVFDPVCDVTFKPVTQFGRTRLVLLSIAQREAPTKPAPAVEEKPVSDVDEFLPRDADNRPAADPKARSYGTAWQSIRAAYANLDMQQYCPPTVSEHDHEHIILKVNSLKELEHLTNAEIGELFVRNCMEIKGMSAPATTKNAPITKEAWTNFLTANKIDADEMLCALDVDRLSEFTGTLDQALAAFNNFVSIDKAQHDAELAANAETHAVDAASAPVANVEATPVPATSAGATAGKPEPQTGHATAVVAELPEAPFSANFKLVNKLGVDVQFTIRAATVSEGIKRVDASIEHLMEQGWTTQRQATQPMQNAQTGGSTAPASNGNKGTAVCSLIKVGKSYTGNKPQLQFECDGFDRTLNYTRDPLVNILKDVQHSGKPFTADALTDGKKFGGEWLVDWDKTEKDGKTYLNVLAVRPSA